MKDWRSMKDDLCLEEIPYELLEAKGGNRRRCLWFRDDNPITANPFIYIPLYSRTEARALDESHLPEVLEIPVAVYKKTDWKNRKYIEYTYWGDDVR